MLDVRMIMSRLEKMNKFSIVLGREEYEYPLPYEVDEQDEEEYYD